MPRSMADPNYVYTPWSASRRLAASEAGRERWARKKAMEPKPVVTADSFLLGVDAMFERAEAEQARHRAAVVEIDNALTAMLCAVSYLQTQFPADADRLEAAYQRIEKAMGV